MKKYGVTTREKLEDLCLANNWLTEVTLSQFTKIFNANESGCCGHTIALLIWMCSPDTAIMDIVEALTLAHKEYEMSERNNDD